MQASEISSILIEKRHIPSEHLDRNVEVDFYLPFNIAHPASLHLLIINDGQNLPEMKFGEMLENMIGSKTIAPILCVAIHAGEERKSEYGTAGESDYMGRGDKASNYQAFILQEVLPLVKQAYFVDSFADISFAGFSLGGLSALDLVWNNPDIFSKAGVFSGSLWWRSIDQDDPAYDDHQHRIMHQRIRKSQYKNGLKFFFQCGNMDETSDRNNNGIIDSIEDTLDLIDELAQKGYDRESDIHYLEMHYGRHDVATWGLAMPAFLKWGWGL